MTNKPVKILFLFLSIMLVACTGSGGNSSNPNPVPTTPASLGVSLDSNDGGFENGATNVSQSPMIILQFTRNMVQSTINESNIILSNSGSGTAPITLNPFVANTSNTKFYFSPTTALQKNIRYHLSINNVEAINGKTINGDFYFTTGNSESPVVSIINSDSNATNVVVNAAAITVNFSKNMTGVNTNNIVLHVDSSNGPSVPLAEITQTPGTFTYTITPATILNYATTYYLTIGSGITDGLGNALNPTTFSFVTESNPVLYVTNFGSSTGSPIPETRVSKCIINNDNSLNCSDSGVGSVFTQPFAIQISSDGNTAYISNSAGVAGTTNMGSVSVCPIISESGTFDTCTDSGGEFLYSAPYGIAINPVTNTAYINDFNINAITTCTMEGNEFHYCYIDNIPLLGNPAGITVMTINDITYAYITNYAKNTVTKCTIGSDSLISGCIDSGAGDQVFSAPFGVAIDTNLNVAYISGHANESSPLSHLYGCQIESSTGSFSQCKEVLNPIQLNNLGANNPSLLTFNTRSNILYFTGSTSNQIIQCLIGNSYDALTCSAVTMTTPFAFDYPTGIAIKY